MKKTVVAAAAVCALFLSVVEAQEQKEVVALTVDQAVEYAKENSRSLKSAQIDLEMKERASKYSWNVFLPTVQASATAARSSDIDATLKQYGISPSKEKYHWAIVGNVSASLNLSLAYIGQIRAAKADYEGGKITWDQSQKQTLMNVKKLFYGLLLQQESLAVKKATLENARQRAAQAEANYRNGLIPELRLLNAQVTYENQKPEIENAEQALNQQLDSFAFLLGFPVGTKLQLQGSIEPQYIKVDSDELLQKYSEGNLGLLALKSQISVLRCKLSALDFKSYTPALSLNYNYQPTKTFFIEDSKWADQGKLSITLAWTLTDMLPFSATRQQAKDIKDNLAKLELKLETAQGEQTLQVKKAVDTLNQAREQIESMGRNITLAQRAYESSARSYRNGATELLDLRDSESQLNQAKLGQLNQKLNYINALMDLEYALNTDLSEYKVQP